MTPEQKITASIIRVLKATPNLWHFKVHGGPMQRAGIPDLCVVFNGLSLWLEIKAPDGKASPLQERTMAQIREAGGLTFVVRSADEVRQILSELPLPAKGAGR